MEPSETAKGYDALAEWWRDQHRESAYGVVQLERAIRFCELRGKSLDVGCGSSGRFMRVLQEAGFTVEGMDVSENMVTLAAEEFPDGSYFQGDISSCVLGEKYAFISAWDSTFHLPYDRQEQALRVMCGALEQGGVLIYTFGGANDKDTVFGEFQGQAFAYSTLGVVRNVELLDAFGCDCVHLEFDQGPSEKHVYTIARKR